MCPHCKHSFAENNPFVRKHMQLSITNIKMLFDKLTESVTYTAIANECDTSITTVLRYCSIITIPKPRTLPTVIGIEAGAHISVNQTMVKFVGYQNQL